MDFRMRFYGYQRLKAIRMYLIIRSQYNGGYEKPILWYILIRSLRQCDRGESLTVPYASLSLDRATDRPQASVPLLVSQKRSRLQSDQHGR